MPHKIKLCIYTQPPYDVLGSSCTCVAGAVGFCNHAIALMYLITHYSMVHTKKIPDDEREAKTYRGRILHRLSR